MADSQAYHTLPYFPYYPAAFDLSTAEFTLSEVGAYQRLLNHQWANGSVPGDGIKALSLILRCTPSTAKSIWNTISIKFVRGEDGRWRNQKMERVRAEAEAFRAKQAENGARGGRPRKPSGNPTETQALTQVITQTEARKSLLLSSSPSPVLSEQQQQRYPRFAGQSHAGHVFGFCDFKCLSEQKVREFSQDLPGGATEPNFAAALKWAESVRDGWGDKPKLEPKWFEFWEARWRERGVSDTSAKDRLVKMLEAGNGR